jgi:hypothetical protein
MASKIPPVVNTNPTPLPLVQPFSREAAEQAGLVLDTKLTSRFRKTTVYRIPTLPGWRIYDAHRDDYPWGYDHDEDGYDYGEVETLMRAIRSIRTYLRSPLR